MRISDSGQCVIDNAMHHLPFLNNFWYKKANQLKTTNLLSTCGDIYLIKGFPPPRFA